MALDLFNIMLNQYGYQHVFTYQDTILALSDITPTHHKAISLLTTLIHNTLQHQHPYNLSTLISYIETGLLKGLAIVITHNTQDILIALQILHTLIKTVALPTAAFLQHHLID